MALQPERGVAKESAPTTDYLEFCVCPDCHSALRFDDGVFTCTRCDHGFESRGGIPILLPTSVDETGRRYAANYDAIAAADLEKPFEGNRPARHQKLEEFIGSVAGKRVLDIGSSDAEYLRHMDAPLRVALDIALEYLERIPAASGVVGVCADAEHLPIRSGYFDVIIISDVLEHVLHPEVVATELARISRPDTRVIVHIPWEEDLTQYRDVPYEFTHLRSFNAYNFALLFKDFYECRSRGTYPYLNMPAQYRLYGKLPRPIYNLTLLLARSKLGPYLSKRWETWVTELPRRERRLLLLYKPIFRQFELRLWSGTRSYRFAHWLRRKARVKPSR